jgi:hypothetical protein
MRLKGKKGGIFQNGRAHKDTSSKKNKKAQLEGRSEQDVATLIDSLNSTSTPMPLAQELLINQELSENITNETSGPLSEFLSVVHTRQHDGTLSLKPVRIGVWIQIRLSEI